MTVAELIAKLQEFPPDMEVVVVEWEFDRYEAPNPAVHRRFYSHPSTPDELLLNSP